jgi:hypothetical protein
MCRGSRCSPEDGAPLRAGSHRLAFAPDGSLWIGQSERQQGWPAGAGIQRLVWTGKTPLEVSAMHLTERGFSLGFTLPLDSGGIGSAGAIAGRRYYYQYHEEYGSPQTDIHPVLAHDLSLSSDRKTLTFAVDTLSPGDVYEFNLNGSKASMEQLWRTS